jgi:hypothetical protein
MITESSTSAVPSEVIQNIDSIQTRVESIQRELSQAMDVWNTTLADEKGKFESLMSHKEMASKEQDEQWARQSQGYEERLAQMKAEFDARLAQAEQNASRALAELDDSWQRDKLEWGPQAQSQWPFQRRELEAKIQALEAKLFELEGEKAARVSQPEPETVHALERQLLEFQETVSQLQSRASQSDELVNACVQALDYQISVLYDLIHHHAGPTPTEDTDLAKP